MASSARKAEANRRNAKKSSGPKTRAGKTASARNATKHGALSQAAVAQHEDPAEFESLFDSLQSHFDPHSPIEASLVEELALVIWRERRLAGFERMRLDRRYDEVVSGESLDHFTDGAFNTAVREVSHLAGHTLNELESTTTPEQRALEERRVKDELRKMRLPIALPIEEQLLVGRYQTMLSNQKQRVMLALRDEQALRSKTIEG